MNIFSNYKSEKPTSSILKAGEHVVNLIRVFMIDSFTKSDGSAKPESIWSAPTQQLGVQVGNIDGSITTRLNGEGYVHADDMDPEQIVEQGLVVVDGFVAKELENGKFERIHSEANSEACKNILNRFFHACSVPEGTTLDELMAMAKDNDITLNVVVEERTWDEKNRLEIKSFKPSSVVAPVEDELA